MFRTSVLDAMLDFHFSLSLFLRGILVLNTLRRLFAAGDRIELNDRFGVGDDEQDECSTSRGGAVVLGSRDLFVRLGVISLKRESISTLGGVTWTCLLTLGCRAATCIVSDSCVRATFATESNSSALVAVPESTSPD